jgi:hypothetical protein
MTIKNGESPAMPLMLTSEMVGLIKSDPTQAGIASGLSKREQFAAMAMQGILSCDSSEFLHIAAQRAVECDDAFLQSWRLKMKDLHKAARDLWQQFSDAGVNLETIDFTTEIFLDGKIKLVEIKFDARLVENGDE